MRFWSYRTAIYIPIEIVSLDMFGKSGYILVGSKHETNTMHLYPLLNHFVTQIMGRRGWCEVSGTAQSHYVLTFCLKPAVL